MKSKHNFVPFLAMTILLLVSLACGSSASPTLVATSAPPVDSGSQVQGQPTQQAPTTPIPTLEFEDVNIVSDLKLTGSSIPEHISEGQNLRITAEVEEYNEVSGLFFLKPVSTEIRP